MLEKGFLKNQKTEKSPNTQFVLLLTNALLYLGLIVLVSSFGYLLLNLDQSDAIIGIILPFLVAGLGLIFVSQIIKRGAKKLRK